MKDLRTVDGGAFEWVRNSWANETWAVWSESEGSVMLLVKSCTRFVAEANVRRVCRKAWSGSCIIAVSLIWTTDSDSGFTRLR